MAPGRERAIVDKCIEQLSKHRRHSGVRVAAGGVAVDLYQFKNTADANAKQGHFFQTTSMSRFDHDGERGITLKGDIKGSECKFWINNLDTHGEGKKIIHRSLRLKHNAILKALLCDESEQLSKSIVAGVYTENFVDWKAKQQVKTADDYLSDEEKDMIISLWSAIEEIWEKGYTSDAISQDSSYVMVSQRIKILPFVIRDRQDGDGKMALRTQLADFLMINLSPLWNNDEFNELISLMKEEYARFCSTMCWLLTRSLKFLLSDRFSCTFFGTSKSTVV